MKWIPTKAHGVLDYLSVGTLLLLPEVFDWDETVTRRVRLAAFGTLLYSLATKYEWGLPPVKVLPMTAHLTCDGTSGALFCAAPWLLPEETPQVKQVLVGVGLFELLVTLISQTEPSTGGN